MTVHRKLRTAAVHALLVVSIGIAATICVRPSAVYAGDYIKVFHVRQKSTSVEPEDQKPTSQQEEAETQARLRPERRGFRIEDIPPERLIEPEPPQLPLPTRRVVAVISEHFTMLGGKGRSRLPTAREWERIRDVLCGRAPALPPAPSAEKPPPEEAPPVPVKPPAAPHERPEEAPPIAVRPVAEAIAAMPTEQAVSLALKVGSEGLSKDYARVVVTSGRISGSTDRKVYNVVGDFTLFYRDIVATAGKGRLDQEAETAELSRDVALNEPKYHLSSDELDIRFKQKTLLAKKFVQFRKKEKSKEPTGTDVPKRQRVINILKNEPTEVYCNSLKYNWDSEEMEASGEVKVVQKDFTATMDVLTYNPRTKLYQMKGKVFATLFNAEWLFEHELIEPKDEQLARALTEKESTMSADFVEVGEDSDVLTIRGGEQEQAELTQEDKHLHAHEIMLDDASKLLTATGDVEFYQENGDWLEKGGLVEKGAEEQLKKRLGKPVTSTSDNLTYSYDKRILQQWGHVQISGENEALFGDELTYDEKGKLLHLKGNVAYYRGEDEYMYADQVVIDTGKNTFRFIGVVEGFMYSTEKAREKAEEARAEAEAAAAAAAGAEGEVPESEQEGGESTMPGEQGTPQPGTQPGPSKPGEQRT